VDSEPAIEAAAPETERLASGRYAGKDPSRLIALENVGMQFESESAAPRLLSGGCHGRYTYSDANSWGRGVNWSSAFYGRLEELGYQTPRTETLKFAREEKAEPELSAIAVIRELVLEDCSQVRSLSIDWRIYDNLHRKVVLELSIVGKDRVVPGEIRRSLLEGFADGLNTLIKDERFQAIVGGEPEAVANADETAEDLTVLSLALRFGSGTTSFPARIDALKAGCVTVRTTSGHGSGLLISPEGHVLTNAHVVGQSTRVVVIFEEQEIDATVLRTDAARDVALLQLTSRAPATPLQISRSIPREGDTLFAMGTPLEEALSHTVTRGILSARREVSGRAFYQTDAAINRGNSGGPIFDEHGDVVAIAVAGVFTKEAGSTSINLLIPIQDALDALRVSSEAPRAAAPAR